MIISITRGDDPAGLIRYLVGTAAALRAGATLIRFDNIASFDTAAKEMAYTASLSERIGRYILHVSASPSPGETLTEAQWDTVWRRIDSELGMQDHQSVTVEHQDGRPHQHRGYNVINPDTHRTPPASRKGNATADPGIAVATGGSQQLQTERRSWDSHLKFRLQRVARELEAELGLASAVAPERWRSRNRSPRPSPGNDQHEQRTGLEPVELAYGDAIRRALRKSDWAERERDLNAIGIGMEAYAGPNTRRRGISFFMIAEPTRRCSGSALGSDYGLGALERSAGETFAAFRGAGRSFPATPAAPMARAPDGLYQQFLAYKAEQRAASELYRLRRLIARQERQLEIDAEIRRQRAMRSAMIAAADRGHRREIARWARVTERLALSRMRHDHRLAPDPEASALLRSLNWSDWLAREAEAGNVSARLRLERDGRRRRDRGGEPHAADTIDPRPVEETAFAAAAHKNLSR